MALRDPGYAIQEAVWLTLTGDAGMAAAFGGPPRIYDTVPLDNSGQVDTAKFPYCTIGEDQILSPRPNSNTDVSEIFVKVESWSRAIDYGEVKLIAGAVRGALDAPIPMIGHDVVTHQFHGALTRREPDGLTRRVITTIRYQTTPVGLSPST